MPGIFVRIFFTWLLLFMIIQPLLGHIDYVLQVVVKSNAEYAAQKTAPAGMLTQDVRTAVLDNLEAAGFNRNSIQLTSNTSSPLSRGEEITIEIRSPRLPMFAYKFTNDNIPTSYLGKAYTTSEYIP
jgi:hypothetical protein